MIIEGLPKMKKTITVKLTQDQARYLDTILYDEVQRLYDEGASPEHGMVQFAKRIVLKLAQAKTS
jgi:hypothetical protein